MLLSPDKNSFRLRANSFETDSDLSLENVDNVLEISNLSESLRDDSTFRQIDYMWLFNPFLKFSQRKNMVLDESSLTVKDYQDMRELNRVLLT